MAGKKRGQDGGDLPRTDLPPTKKPYDEDYFGTGEEEGVVRERDASGDADEDDAEGDGKGEGPHAA